MKDIDSRPLNDVIGSLSDKMPKERDNNYPKGQAPKLYISLILLCFGNNN